jgi:hypothetical protein
MEKNFSKKFNLIFIFKQPEYLLLEIVYVIIGLLMCILDGGKNDQTV